MMRRANKRVEREKRRERGGRDGKNEGNRLEEGAIKNDDDDSFLIRCLPGVGRSFFPALPLSAFYYVVLTLNHQFD